MYILCVLCFTYSYAESMFSAYSVFYMSLWYVFCVTVCGMFCVCMWHSLSCMCSVCASTQCMLSVCMCAICVLYVQCGVCACVWVLCVGCFQNTQSFLKAWHSHPNSEVQKCKRLENQFPVTASSFGGSGRKPCCVCFLVTLRYQGNININV